MTSATVILFQGWTRSDPVVKVTEYEGLTVRDMRHEIARHLHKNGKYLDVPEDTLASRIVISGHGAKNEKGERLDIMSVMDTPVLWEHVGLAKYRVNDKPSPLGGLKKRKPSRTASRHSKRSRRSTSRSRSRVSTRCQGKTREGKRCRHAALPRRKYCAQH